ncbi:conserved hypothetical protein [delta proteobacterium NaphS2]|nr:conserved hypothetical protein [delta proteobacterium NaphS2]
MASPVFNAEKIGNRVIPRDWQPTTELNMQIVYISNRKDIAYETLEYAENLMPFLTEAVFVCPGSQLRDFCFKNRLKVTVMDEAEVLGKDWKRFLKAKDHQFRNCLLRFSLPRLSEIDDEFIMSDDDNRPLAKIPLSFYKSEGKYTGYYFYDLKDWSLRETDYDLGQLETCRILEKGYGTLSYSSHMPQIIHKGLLAETAEVFKDSLALNAPLDEWSAYFNYGQSVYPERFHSPELYKTLCWPPFPSDWKFHVRPDEFFFENFYPMLYESGSIFSDLPTRFDEMSYAEIANKKIERRMSLQNAYEAGNLSFFGKMFFRCRDLAERLPRLKRRLNAMIPSSKRVSMLNYFLGTSCTVRSKRDPNGTKLF